MRRYAPASPSDADLAEDCGVAAPTGHGDAAVVAGLGEGAALLPTAGEPLAVGEGLAFAVPGVGWTLGVGVGLGVGLGLGVGRADCTWAGRLTMTGVPSGRLGTETSTQVARRR